MIPIEVANIAAILRDYYPKHDAADSEEEFDYSVEIAWKIYNLMDK